MRLVIPALAILPLITLATGYAAGISTSAAPIVPLDVQPLERSYKKLVEATFGMGFACGYNSGQIDAVFTATKVTIGVETEACLASIPRALAAGFEFPLAAADRRGMNHPAKVE